MSGYPLSIWITLTARRWLRFLHESLHLHRGVRQYEARFHVPFSEDATKEVEECSCGMVRVMGTGEEWERR